MKRRLLALLLVLCCICLSSCATLTDNVMSVVADKANETGAETLARQFLDGILANDAEASLSAMVPGVTMESLMAVWPQMQALLPDTSSYTLTPIHWKTNTAQGVTMHAFQFQLMTANASFIVETLHMAGVNGLYNIHIAPYAPENGTPVSGVQEHPAIDAAFTLLSAATVLFVLWALVDCCRHKFRRKWLWVLAILLGNVLLLLTLTDSRLNFNLHLGLYLNATAFRLRDGGFYISLLIPAGSVAYLTRRKHLLAPTSQKGFAEAFPESAITSDASDTAEQP